MLEPLFGPAWRVTPLRQGPHPGPHHRYVRCRPCRRRGGLRLEPKLVSSSLEGAFGYRLYVVRGTKYAARFLKASVHRGICRLAYILCPVWINYVAWARVWLRVPRVLRRHPRIPLSLWIVGTIFVYHVSWLVNRFLYSDLEPLSELGIVPDPHPEGPSSLPTEAPPDIRKELANERRREGLRKAAVSTRLPRLTQVCIASINCIGWAGLREVRC